VRDDTGRGTVKIRRVQRGHGGPVLEVTAARTGIAAAIPVAGAEAEILVSALCRLFPDAAARAVHGHGQAGGHPRPRLWPDTSGSPHTT
jgi:hypothetical protein